MPKVKKYNPVAYPESFILLSVILIAVLSAAVLAIYNYIQHH